MATPTTSSSSRPPWKYDVFLSFRGEDTRLGLTDHFYHALEHKAIHTFRDDEKLERGKDISPTLLEAIEDSQFAVVIFSKNYASSSWCLDEVAKIAECKKQFGQIVLPIFYNVEPAEVRKQEGSFAKAFAKHRENYKDNMERVDIWAKALFEIASISGWDTKHRHESNMIQDVVKNILRTLDLTYQSTEDKDLVGMVSRLRKMESYLDIESGGVSTLGLWGTGGIGKTTTAKEVINRLGAKFDACGFVNVREQSEKLGLVHVKKQLYGMLLDEKIKIQNVDNQALKRRLQSKKVLIVLDDVDQLQQIEALVGKADQQPNWFGQKSRIIVTTRNKHLLRSYGEENIYEVEELTDEEALRLFCQRAFKKSEPKEEFEELSKNVVKYAQGLPLALELLGCLLNGRGMDEWVDAVNRLEENPNYEICKTLRLSYEGLERNEKNIFLDIACFFKGEDDHRVKKILESCELHPTIGISILVEKSLITIEGGKLCMHDMVQKMGWDVVEEESREPGKRSRIWLYEESNHVLTENTGSGAVEGLFLSRTGEEKVESLSVDPFSEMKNIRLLKICNVYFSGCLQYYLSKKLRLLEWHGCPMETLPSSFQPDKLVEFSIPNSRIKQLWKETEVSERLTLINLRNCEYLTKTPDFSKAPNLESLILEGCKRLREVHPSIGVLPHLVTLNLNDCESLERLPRSINLKALKTFTLSGCTKLSEFPEILEEMENLAELDLERTAISELPVSISNLTGLILLTVSFCKNLSSLPGNSLCSLTFLKYLIMSSSSQVDELPENIGNLENLEQLFADGTSIRKVPSSILLLKKLKTLSFRGCKGLQLPNSLLGLFSLTQLDLSFCGLPEGAIPDDIGRLSLLETLHLGGNNFTSIPDTISELSLLKELWLYGCFKLQSLPKNLPSSLKKLDISDCPMLKIPNTTIITTSENGFQFINSHNTLDSTTDSILGTPCPMPEEHIDQLLPKLFEERINDKNTFEIRFPLGNKFSECCSNWIADSSNDRNSIMKGIALFVVFEIKKLDNLSDEDRESEQIHCHIHTEEGRMENFHSFVNFKKFLVGSFGACSYIPLDQFPRGLIKQSQVIGVSFSVNRPDLELKTKKCGMHFIHEQNVKEFCQELALCSSEHLNEEVMLCQHCKQLLDDAMIGNVKTIFNQQPHYEEEENYTEEETTSSESQMKRDVESLFSRLFQGRIAQTSILFFLIPVKVLPLWFFHHSLGDTTICCYLPPNLHHDKSWLGLQLFAVFERRQSENPTMLGVEVYIHAGNNTIPVLRYDIFIDGTFLGPQLVLYHIPRESFPEELNQSKGISVLFRPTTPDIEVEFCGTGFLYEKDSKRLVKQITNMTFGRPDILSSLHQQAQSILRIMEDFCGKGDVNERNGVEQRTTPDLGCMPSFQREKELIESLHKLLANMQPMTNNVSTSTLHNYRYGLRDKHGSVEEYHSRSGVLFHSPPCSIQLRGTLTHPCLYHSHVMVETLFHGNDFEKWKRNLQLFLDASFNSCGLVTLSLKGHIISVLKYFNPLAPFNFNFPSKEIPEWFNHQSNCSTSGIELPPNLHEDDNWMGLVICAAFSIHENPSSFSETSFKILCHLMTDRSCVNAVPVHFITKDKFSWLHLRGFIWLTYVPHALLTDLNESSCVLARIYNRSPGLLVDKCGIRLLYKQDLPEFKQSITQCWTSFFDDLDPIFQFVANEDGNLLHEDYRVATRGTSSKVLQPINAPKTNQDFDVESVYNACFPPTETLDWFANLGCDHLATINLPQGLYSDVNWVGLALCAYFSNLDDQQPAATTSLDHLDSKLFSHYLFCHFETGGGILESIHKYQYQRSGENLNHIDEKEFIWVSFLPRRWFLENIPPSCQLNECGIMEASFGSDVRAMVANKCGLRLVYQHDQEEFKQVLNNLMDCQQSDQETQAKDGKVQDLITNLKAISPFYIQSRYAISKESPVVKGPIVNITKVVERIANPTNQEDTTLEDTTIDPSIAEFDDIVSDIKKCLDDSKKTSELESGGNSQKLVPTHESIRRAKKILKQFMEMKLDNLVHPGRKYDLKDSLSILLSTKNIFPKDMVDEMTKFSELFNQNCGHYETAQGDLKAAKEKENSVVQLEDALKQFTSELIPMKTEAEAIDREIADLDKQLSKKKAARDKLKSSFENLRSRANVSRQALVEAKREEEAVAKKKKEAEDFVKELDDGWEALKACCSKHI